MSDADPLDALALRYIARYAVPSAGLRKYLQRKMRELHRKSETPVEASDADVRARIEAVIARFLERGWINDESWTERKVELAQARGRSRRHTQAMLAHNGVDRELATAATSSWTEADDLEAARRIVTRRRLGYLRSPGERADRHTRDLGVLARAGFSLSVARRALEAPDDED